MSYSAYTNYYNSASQVVDRQSTYGTSQNGRVSGYPGNLPTAAGTTTGAYGDPQHDWTSGQSAYSSNTSTHRQSDAYPQSIQPSSYTYQQTSHAPMETSSISQAQPYCDRPATYAPSPSATRPEGLKEIVHKSGFDGIQKHSNRGNSRYDTVPSGIQHNTKSPGDLHAQHRSGNRPSNGVHDSQTSNASSVAPHVNDRAVDATAASAEAINRRFLGVHPSYPSTSLGSSYDTAVTNRSRRTPPPQTTNKETHQYTPVQLQSSDVTQSSIRIQSSSKHGRTPLANMTSAHDGSISRQKQQQQSIAPRQPRTNVGANKISNLSTDTEGRHVADQAVNNTQANATGFIDPASVFNPYRQEHERRQREAEKAAVAKQKQEEADAARKRQEEAEAAANGSKGKDKDNNSKAKRKRGPKKSKKASTNAEIEPADNPDEAMALEMKAMLEKMKTFRSKDPGLFQKLWDDMRPPVVSAVSAPSQVNLQAPSVPTISAQEYLSSEQGVPAADSLTMRKRGRRAQAGGGGESLHLNGYSVLVEDNRENLPDLGRFPAERRVRSQKYVTKKSAKSDEPVVALNSHASLQLESGTETAQHNNPGTVWPHEKRQALVQTAMHVLKANPNNINVQMTNDEFRAILEDNPSYLTLCELLEQRGFEFHRSQFARGLLNSVPDLKPQDPSNRTAPATNASNGPEPVSQQRQSTIGPPLATFTPREYRPEISLVTGVPSSTHKTPKPKHSARTEPPPGAKEVAARKRDLSELIDLTELEDDDRYVAPDKHQRMDGVDSDDDMSNMLQAFQTPPRKITPVTLVNAESARQGQFGQQAQALRFDTTGPPASNYRQDAPLTTSSSRMILTKRLNKDEGMRKKYYDPTTIARDILIATGRHPMERPLNVHMAGMLGRYIELDSDLSTFEWDELDPGGPPMPRVATTDILTTKPRHRLGDRVKMFRGPRKARADTSRAPDLDKRQTRDPTITQTNVPDSDGIVRSKSRLHQSVLAEDVDPTLPVTPARLDNGAITSEGPQSRNSDSRVTFATPANNMETPDTIKRRGRPPGSKNKYPSMASLKQQANVVTKNIDRPAGMMQERVKHEDHFRCKWKECHAVPHNLNTLRMHIGKVHRATKEDQAVDGWICWWKKCRYLVPAEDGGWHTTQVFDNAENWLRHIEKDHVGPIAVKYGEGPRTEHIDPRIIEEDRAAYLRNRKGEIVTPDIPYDISQLPEDPIDLRRRTPEKTDRPDDPRDPNKYFNEEKGAREAYLKAHKISKDSERASQQIIAAMKKRKEKIGWGIDKGGCTLITESMRDRFEQNPGIRRIVDDE